MLKFLLASKLIKIAIQAGIVFAIYYFTKDHINYKSIYETIRGFGSQYLGF